MTNAEFELATEAGFTGERRVCTWRGRIKQLEGLGFAQMKSGSKGPYQNILTLNPCHILFELNQTGKIQSEYWQFVLDRVDEIGAKDITSFR